MGPLFNEKKGEPYGHPREKIKERQMVSKDKQNFRGWGETHFEQLSCNKNSGLTVENVEQSVELKQRGSYFLGKFARKKLISLSLEQA